jgi:hypothetical protein
VPNTHEFPLQKSRPQGCRVPTRMDLGASCRRLGTDEMRLNPRETSLGELVSVTRGWHQVDVSLDLLEVRETTGAAQRPRPLCL